MQDLFGYVQKQLAAVDRMRRGTTGPSSLKTEMFVWRVIYRDGTTDSETQGEGFWRVRADQVERIELIVPLLSRGQGGEVGVHHDIPAGASAVFARRRTIAVQIATGISVPLPGWTLIGHQWPDGHGQYFFYRNDGSDTFASTDYNDPRSVG